MMRAHLIQLGDRLRRWCSLVVSIRDAHRLVDELENGIATISLRDQSLLDCAVAFIEIARSWVTVAIHELESGRETEARAALQQRRAVAESLRRLLDQEERSRRASREARSTLHLLRARVGEAERRVQNVDLLGPLTFPGRRFEKSLADLFDRIARLERDLDAVAQTDSVADLARAEFGDSSDDDATIARLQQMIHAFRAERGV